MGHEFLSRPGLLAAIVGAVCVLASSIASAEQPNDLRRKIDQFTATTQLDYAHCATAIEHGYQLSVFEKTEPDPAKVMACKQEIRSKEQPQFLSLKRSLLKNKPAEAAFKAYYAKWLGLVDQLSLGPHPIPEIMGALGELKEKATAIEVELE